MPRLADPRTAGPPDFVGVGAHRSATAAWSELLAEHPAIAPSRLAPDEPPHFFDEFCTRPMTDADVAAYHRRFPRPAGALTGEWRPRYMYNPWTAPLLKRAAPEARLLVLLGDPVTRYRVNLAAADLDPENDREQYLPDLVGRARYATQLERLWAWFPRERTLVLQHERCREDPAGEYRRTLDFLGVDPSFLPRRLRRWRGGRDDRDLRFPTGLETAKRRVVGALRRRHEPEPQPLWPELEAALLEELDPEVERLKRLVPDLDVSLWPSFAP